MSRKSLIRDLVRKSALGPTLIASKMGIQRCEVLMVLKDMGFSDRTLKRLEDESLEAHRKSKDSDIKHKRIPREEYDLMSEREINKISTLQEPVGCRYIYGDVKEDANWRYCQEEIMKKHPDGTENTKLLCGRHYGSCIIRSGSSRRKKERDFKIAF